MRKNPRLKSCIVFFGNSGSGSKTGSCAGAIMRKAHKKNQIQDNDNLLTGSKSNE